LKNNTKIPEDPVFGTWYYIFLEMQYQVPNAVSKFFFDFSGIFVPVPNAKKRYFSDLAPVLNERKLNFYSSNSGRPRF
jgi:hypothetical protein